ncbi:MAG TPA: DUF1343 domain-containing protein [Chitinophagaceae bacterium]|nr:DUF1343 domain-containing protein [Chitinophagaceae bacterium]
MKKTLLLIILFTIHFFHAQKRTIFSQPLRSFVNDKKKLQTSNQILPGAYQTIEYLPLLKNKRVAVFANQTSVIGNTHLVDSLKKLGVNIVKIFAPEHGFRGTADAGAKVQTYTDEQTGIPVISLYGSKVKPSKEDLKDVDILLFDIQDVGLRFYTYISSLQYFLESAIENKKPIMILDRPNPNGFYVDGPVLDTAYKSFVGMQPIPVVYGMTIGEYATMLYEERMLSEDIKKLLPPKSEKQTSPIIVIHCKNYTHRSRYTLTVNPSPNLPYMGSVYWYPSTCFFEGTVITEGRGTDHPFQIFGHPKLPDFLYNFTPHSKPGATEPKFKDQLCYGWNLYGTNNTGTNTQIQLKWLLQAYQLFPDKENFFLRPKKSNPAPKDYSFNRLAGNNELMQQIIDGKTEEEIRKSWQPKLEAFKKIRKKYLLYPDF